MPYESDDLGQPAYRILSLVQYCQRVLVANAEGIASLGNGLRYDLIKPILESCSADSLLRLEQASPYLEEHTPEIWKNLCMRTYPILAHQYRTNSVEEPESWRDQYFVQRDLEAQRLEAVGSRLRNQRAEAEERKKESSIKITDRLPPAKRSRGWIPTQPKSLLQKTRSEAARMHKGIYGMRMLPMPKAKDYTRTASSSNTRPYVPPAASSSGSANSSRPQSSAPVQGSRLTVTAVPRRPAPPPTLKPSTSSARSIASTSSNKASPPKPTMIFNSQDTPPKSPAPPPPQTSPNTLTAKPPLAKKDKTSTLFMPKHRAHSQLPAR
ncbi:hypothetical protein CERSUDRAFT_104685 [Gelatoporia subvermispora B]|uniref:Elongin-A n=1 Tax=Ceriporiopsis subvermispora (strain B) TaxID=914234 RepID=M2RHV5_CERS8|nr:hypothetical protein CERSUDRAFT_104685 [Gelatoporia subvermispora B]